MRIARLLFGSLVVLALALGGFFLLSSHKEIAAIAVSSHPAFDKAVVAEGAQLAAIGNCDVCHTVQGGPAYAGSRPIPTPFGTVYSANITPHPETGIGSWTSEQIITAIRKGKTPDGAELSGVMPYAALSHLTDEDAQAIVVFLKSLPAVSNEVKNFGPNEKVTVSVSAVLPPDVYNALPAPKK